ncbi:MAG: YqaA family protein [Alphaproteobacteria bacterium]|nr:YqaA family protein [Alphaproteobacteria bacterium]
MLTRLYTSVMDLAGRRGAMRWLAGISFIESSIFPIPPDVMLIPMILADRRRAFVIAGVCTIASVLGGLAGYAIGALLWEALGAPLVNFYGYEHKMARFAEAYNEWGAWLVFTFGIIPLPIFPYKVITIASGFTELNLLTFTIASLLARGLRFYAVAGLLYWFGEPIRGFIERNLGLLTIVFVVGLFGGFLAIKLWF